MLPEEYTGHVEIIQSKLRDEEYERKQEVCTRYRLY